MNDQNSIPTAIFAAIAVCAFFILMFSQRIGADFMPTLTAVIVTIAVIVIAVLVVWLTKYFSVLLYASIMAATIWPFWWPVLKSIALNSESSNSDLLFPRVRDSRFPIFEPVLPDVWFVSGYFLWGVEIVFLAVAAYAVYTLLTGSRRW